MKPVKHAAGWVASRTPVGVLDAWPERLGKVFLAQRMHYSLHRFSRDFRRRTTTGFVFDGNTSEVIQRHIYLHGKWEPEITRWVQSFLRPGDHVLDVGANTGYFSLLAATVVGPSGHVVAAEPVPSIFAELTSNLAANPEAHVTALNQALGGREGTTEIFRATSENIGNSSTVHEAGFVSEGSVTLSTVDAELSDEFVERLRLIKIDTEGDEANVLQGAHAVLAKLAPGSAVLVEVTPEKLATRGQAPTDVWSHFPAEDWTAWRIENDYELSSYVGERDDFLSRATAPDAGRADMIFIKQ